MSTQRQQNAASHSRVVANFACVFLFACSCFSLAGCSDATVKEPEEKKNVVQDLDGGRMRAARDTPPNAGAEGSTSEVSPVEEQSSPEDEIESLPFDPQAGQEQQEEKELPVLGE